MNKYLAKAKEKWNAKADEFNQWNDLDSDEKFELWFEVLSGQNGFYFIYKELAKLAWDSALDEYVIGDKQ